MAKIEAGMEGMLDMYIFETTSLLEQLDQILMKTESEHSFSTEEINEIFRTMHTIKGLCYPRGKSRHRRYERALRDTFLGFRSPQGGDRAYTGGRIYGNRL